MVPAAFVKKLLVPHGEVRPQSSSEWTGAFPIPFAVEQFYREVGPCNVTIKAYGNPFFLPSLGRLWDYQAGYRWHGLTGESIDDWPDDWLVVADEGGGAFIFVRSTEAVLHCLHGAGSWDASKAIFPDLNTMAACLALLGGIVREAGDHFTQEDCTIRPQYRELALARIQELLAPKADAEAVLEILAWD